MTVNKKLKLWIELGNKLVTNTVGNKRGSVIQSASSS